MDIRPAMALLLVFGSAASLSPAGAALSAAQRAARFAPPAPIRACAPSTGDGDSKIAPPSRPRPSQRDGNADVAQIDALAELLPGVDVPSVVLRAPALLTIDATLLSERLRSLQGLLPAGTSAVRLVEREPTLLHLSDVAERLDRLSEAIPAVDAGVIVRRAPSLLGYNVSVVRGKLEQLRALFPGRDVDSMLKREPGLLTFAVDTNLASKLSVFEQLLPDIDVRKLLVSTPRLLLYDAENVLPSKLAALRSLLPGADVPRLVKNVPQLLEYDVEGSLVPKLVALRRLFRSSPPPPPPPNAAQRLATAKLLGARRPNPGRRASSGRRAGLAAPRGTGSAAAAAAAAGSSRRPLTTIGLLRLSALDVSVVERRLGRLAALLPEVDTIALVSRQPSLLRRDVDQSLRPRLAYMCERLGGDAAAASKVVTDNPRLLLSGWGVLGRLRFVAEAVPGGLREMSPSTAIMTPKANFASRFPEYVPWLRGQLQARGIDDGAVAVADGGIGSAAKAMSRLEARHGDLIEQEQQQTEHADRTPSSK